MQATQLQTTQPTLAELQKEKAQVKEATKQADLIGKKVKELDGVTSGIYKRLKDANDNLTRMRYEYDKQMANIKFVEESRAKLVSQMSENQEKSKHLRSELLKCEKKMGKLRMDMQLGARHATLEGVQDIGTLQHGLKDSNATMMPSDIKHLLAGLKPKEVQKRLQARELAALRGYSCDQGTTPGPNGIARGMGATASTGMGASRSLPRL
eukprot:TRINITY_DN91934_c0_g1_i1.p1 TRINITY_DN91934_c0_g1~~TRINITY_DN91934_c0_g1_i1.p1  ORF type:complete len:210 (-),score=71.67 TRINITY_DN91934_c0_g1_i1:279-908(-)